MCGRPQRIDDRLKTAAELIADVTVDELIYGRVLERRPIDISMPT